MTIRFRPWPAVSAAILAGGVSRRMGADKALLTLRPGGEPVIARVLAAVRQIADDVSVISAPRPELAALGVPVVADQQAGLGPLGGIATALATARHDHCLIVSCDLPFLNPTVLAWMAAVPRDYELLLPLVPRNKTKDVPATAVPQPLHAIYARSSLSAILAQIDTGDLRLSRLLPRLNVRSIGEAELRALDADLRSFFNMNTPEDARRAARLAAESG